MITKKEKISARSKLKRAVKMGKIKKPKKCPTCKREVPLQGHHTDYTKPYDVTWLCGSCHMKIHGSENGKLGANKTHQKRYEIIKLLSAYVDKAYQNYLLSWPTEHLKRLLDAYTKNPFKGF